MSASHEMAKIFAERSDRAQAGDDNAAAHDFTAKHPR